MAELPQIEEKIRVYVRQRPSLLGDNLTEAPKAVVLQVDGACTYKQISSDKARGSGSDEASNDKMFKFSGCFDESSTQEAVFNEVARPLLDSVLLGYSATILAYGATASGKTYSILGDTSLRDNYGIMPRCVEYLFSRLSQGELHMSFLQIYCENITDLLNADDYASLNLRETDDGQVFVEGLTRIHLQSLDDFFVVQNRADSRRKTASTNINLTSSRSHAVYMFFIKLPIASDDIAVDAQVIEGSLVLVDLAGSERASASEGRNYMRFEEAKAINLSLSSLGNCVSALVAGRKHIPYRDSKLTRVLQPSLSGKCRVSILATIGYGSDDNGELLNTLRFAARASRLAVTAKISKIVDFEKLYHQFEGKVLSLSNTIADMEEQLQRKTSEAEEQFKEIDELRSKIRLLEEKEEVANALMMEQQHNNGATKTSHEDINQKLALLKQRYETELSSFRAKYESKIQGLEVKLKESTANESRLQLELMKEKQHHLNSLRDYRELQENNNRTEEESISRRDELLNDLQEKQKEIDELTEQLGSMTAYAKRTTDKLESLELSMNDMVSLQQVKEMESLFMETVTKLTDRVKQLEAQRQPSRETLPSLRETDPNLPYANYSVKPGGSGAVRLEPGGRVRR